MNRRHFVSTTAGLLAAAGRSAEEAALPRLRELFADDFLIGFAAGSGLLQDGRAAEQALAAGQFNVLTCENEMKPGPVHPEPDTYRWQAADALVGFAEANGLKVHGHTLVWHSQTGAWMFQDVDRAGLLARLKTHIDTVAGRYRGRIISWDVVNEAVENDGLRNSPWRQIAGDDFIERAFEYAAAADPEARLYYNDYGICVKPKRDQVVALVKRIQQAGLRIDGVGIQGHWNLTWPGLGDIEQSLQIYRDLGAKIAISELDIDVLPRRGRSADVSATETGTDASNPYVAGLPAAVADQQARRYEAIFKLFLKYRETIERVTFWGLSDGSSWLNNFPVRGRTNHPLLFDRQLTAKPAFWAVAGLKT